MVSTGALPLILSIDCTRSRNQEIKCDTLPPQSHGSVALASHFFCLWLTSTETWTVGAFWIVIFVMNIGPLGGGVGVLGFGICFEQLISTSNESTIAKYCFGCFTPCNWTSTINGDIRTSTDRRYLYGPWVKWALGDFEIKMDLVHLSKWKLVQGFVFQTYAFSEHPMINTFNYQDRLLHPLKSPIVHPYQIVMIV